MRTVMKWIGRGVLAVVAILVLAAGAVYAVSEQKMSRSYEVDARAVEIPDDSASIAEGERLARIYGCYNGCHGEAAEGGLFFDEPMMGTVKAPDLTRAARTLSAEELVGVIRYGVRPDGSSVFVMPSVEFYHLTDEDIGAIVAFLRSLPESDGPATSVKFGPLGRALFAIGEFEPAAPKIDPSAPRLEPGDGSDPMALGEYLAVTACAECHGTDLAGQEHPTGNTPNLAIAAAYSPEEFRTLMRTGEPRDGRELRLMDDMSLKRFKNLTDGEIAAVHTYLSKGLAGDQASEASPAATD